MRTVLELCHTIVYFSVVLFILYKEQFASTSAVRCGNKFEKKKVWTEQEFQEGHWKWKVIGKIFME
jgi:hypothetical protein